MAAQTDVLLVVDMQNDFVPASAAPCGGRFGVAEGEVAASVCVRVIDAFAAAGNLILASRDYHPAYVQSWSRRPPPSLAC